jgi:hypothetical protein
MCAGRAGLEDRDNRSDIMIDESKHTEPQFTPEQLARLGDGAIAYVKPLLSEEAQRLFPQAPEMRPGLKLFALLGADGTPIMLTDSRDAALANAWSHELHTVSLH